MTTGKGWTFDTQAEKYDKMRPGYPEELYETIKAYRPFGPSSVLLEIGIGTGQATVPFLNTGCRVTAVEPGENLARICEEKFGTYPGFRVINARFEETDTEEDRYELAYSATAFHWVPEEIGYPMLFRSLKRGGAFARFRNHPFACYDQAELRKEIRAAYSKHYYRHYTQKAQSEVKEYTENEAEALMRLAGKYGFSDLQCRMFSRIREFTAEEYTELLMTYSDHITLPQEIRDPFLYEIREAIGRHGGILRIRDTIDLELAKKE